MVSAFLNSVKIPELRRRILFTLAVIVIVRLGAAITTPGVNPAVLQDWFRTSSQSAGGGVAALFNLFSGGALENCAIFSLGIMPYISASIMLQLLTAVIPSLSRLSREDGGRQKIMQVHPLCDGRALHLPGVFARGLVPASGVVSHDASRHHRDDGATRHSAG